MGSRRACAICLILHLGVYLWHLLLPLAPKYNTSTQRRCAIGSPYLISNSMSGGDLLTVGGVRGGRRGLYPPCPYSSLTTLPLWVNGLWGLNLDCGWSPLPQINVAALGQFTGICSGMFSRLCWRSWRNKGWHACNGYTTGFACTRCLVVTGFTSCPCNNTRTSSRLMLPPASELAVQADHAVNLVFMTERLDETLIPYLVTKTSWHKLSTVWGHSESCFLSPGPQNALWLTTEEENTPWEHSHWLLVKVS